MAAVTIQQKVAVTLQQILDWCEQQRQKNDPFIISWDGGGDDGYFDLDRWGKYSSSPEAAVLADLIYGAGILYFTGEMSRSGSAVYMPEEKVFRGVDTYIAKDDHYDFLYKNFDQAIEIRVPARIPFQRLVISNHDKVCEGHFEFDQDEILDNDTRTLAHQEAERLRDRVLDRIYEDEYAMYEEGLIYDPTSGKHIKTAVWDEEWVDPDFPPFTLEDTVLKMAFTISIEREEFQEDSEDLVYMLDRIEEKQVNEVIIDIVKLYTASRGTRQ